MAFVSPGTYQREIDLSLYAQSVSTSILGLGGVFTKGPVNEETLITNPDQLVSTFGKPRTDAQGFYAAREYLRRGNQLQVVRVGASSSLAKAYIITQDAAAIDSIKFEAITFGTGFNGLTVYITAGTEEDTWKVSIEEDGILVESWDNLDRANVEATINDVSDFITVEVLNVGTADEPVYPSDPLVLANGDDGLTGIAAGDIIGVSGTNKTGLQLLRNPEAIDINLICAPGFSNAAVVAELLDIAQSRADTLALIDPPDIALGQDDPTQPGYTGVDDPTDIVDWHNGKGDYTDHGAFNSSYGEVHWPWVQVYDEYNDERVWIAPSGIVSGVMAYNDAVRYPWFAPAGFRRGKIGSALALRYSPDRGERNVLYGPGNNVNAFVKFVKDGIVGYGQKTLQRTPTALDRINVRRMLLFVEKTIATAIRFIEFEPNDPATQREFRGIVEPVLRNVTKKRGIKDFLVVCDDTTNPPDVVDKNEIRGKAFIKPTKTAEIVVLDYILTSQGANFTELLQAAA